MKNDDIEFSILCEFVLMMEERDLALQKILISDTLAHNIFIKRNLHYSGKEEFLKIIDITRLNNCFYKNAIKNIN